MGDVLLAIGYLLSLVVAAGVVLWARDRLTAPRTPNAAEREAGRQEYEARLLKPQWSALSAVAGTAPLPDALRELYQDRDLILSTDLDVIDARLSGGEDAVWAVDRFCPADRDAIAEQWQELPRKSFTFAECEGDPYYVILGGSAPDGGPVHHFYHDGSETVTVAPTLALFLECCRDARRNRDRR